MKKTLCIKILFVCLQSLTYNSWVMVAHSTDGLFYCSNFDTKINGVVLPCKDYNGFYAHECVLSNGEGDAVFSLPEIKCLTPMNKKNEFDYLPVIEAFAMLKDLDPDITAKTISENLHDLIFRITQIPGAELNLSLQNDLYCVESLYQFFSKPAIINLLKTI